MHASTVTKKKVYYFTETLLIIGTSLQFTVTHAKMFTFGIGIVVFIGMGDSMDGNIIQEWENALFYSPVASYFLMGTSGSLGNFWNDGDVPKAFFYILTIKTFHINAI